MNRGRQYLFLVLVWFAARPPGVESAAEEIFKFLQEFRADKRPGRPLVTLYFSSELFGVKFVRQDISKNGDCSLFRSSCASRDFICFGLCFQGSVSDYGRALEYFMSHPAGTLMLFVYLYPALKYRAIFCRPRQGPVKGRAAGTIRI